MLKSGSRGSAVRNLQQQLKAAGFDPGPIDGVFGPRTDRAVRAFQSARGLKVDGIAGPQTMGALGGGGAPASGGGAPAPAAGGINEQDMAAKYGMALAVINSDPSLRGVFDQAVRENWTTEMFVARARETDWYKRNSESMRQALILKNADPATWNQRLQTMKSQIRDIAGEIGAAPGGALDSLADQALTFGWSDAQVRDVLSQYMSLSDGTLHGQARQISDEIYQMAADMGIRLGDSTVQAWTREIIAGNDTVDAPRGFIQNMAESAFPHLRDRLRAGETLADIASPYRQAMADILEVNPESVDVFDTTIRSALAGSTQDGQPAMKTIWQFEKDLRKDPRWLKTNNAREQSMAVARQVLTDFGLAS